MIKTDKIRKPQPVLFYIIDYLWSGFTGLSVAMMVVASGAWGSSVFGEFMLPAPADVFKKPLSCSSISNKTKSVFHYGVPWWVLPLH